jgi:hypothetical protein
MIFGPFPNIELVHRLLDERDTDPQYERRDLYEHILSFDWLEADWKHTAGKHVSVLMGPFTGHFRILGYMVRSALELLPHDVGSVLIVRHEQHEETSLGLIYSEASLPNDSEAPSWFSEARTEPPRSS